MKATLRLLVCATACALATPRAFPADPAPPRPQPFLEIEQKMPENVEPGAPFVVEVVVRNTGSAPAEGVTVTDQLPAGCDLQGVAPTPERTPDALIWRLGRLGPGEQALLRMRVATKAGQAPPRNAVDATFQAHTSSVCSARLSGPELSLTVAAPDAVFTGQPVPFRIVIENKGAGAARDVTLRALIGEGLSNPNGSDLEAGVGVVGPGESRTVTLQATATRPGDLRGSFSVRAQGAAPVQRVVVCRAEEDHLNVTVSGPTTLHAEFTGLFGLTVANDGTTTVRQVVLTAVLPEGLAFVRATDDGAYDPATRTLTWTLGDVQPGERRELAWNGTAQGTGELKAKVRLAAGAQTRREIAWATRVADGGAARPAAGVAKTPGE
jgi:uncharacterized repeat protein (TIGR01451 family)